MPVADLGEAYVENRILLPVFVIVVPPLRLVDGEALGLHRGAQDVAQPTLFGRAARVRDVRALGHLVELAGHRDLAARLQVVEREVNGAAAVVARAFGGVCDELLLVGGRQVPEELRHRPGAVAVEDREAVALFAESAADANESLGGGALEEGACFGVDGAAREVVRGGVAYV